MKKLFVMKENQQKLAEIKKELLSGNQVEVWNAYETFYGTGFGRWLRESLKDIPCSIKVIGYDKFEGFESEFIISPNK